MTIAAAVVLRHTINNILPVVTTDMFRIGAVGVGLFRQLKTLVMACIAAESSAARHQFMADATDVIIFIRDLTRIFPCKEKEWFDTTREVVMNNNDPEDILPFLLAKGVLDIAMPKNRLARWLEVSLRRSLRRTKHLRDNPISILVWLYTTRLTGDAPDVSAMYQSFEDLEACTSYDNQSMVKLLLQKILPELAAHADLFLDAASRIDEKDVCFVPPVRIVFDDGSVLEPSVNRVVPHGLKVVGGTLATAATDGRSYSIDIRDLGQYTAITVQRPGGSIVITLYGRPIRNQSLGGNGAGVVVRTTATPITSSKSFIGSVGLTLRGGRGDGKSKPSQERQSPRFMEVGSEEEIRVCTVTFAPDQYTVGTDGWASPLVMKESLPYGSIYIKGIRNPRIEINEVGMRLSAMRSSPEERYCLTHLSSVIKKKSGLS